MASVEFPFSTTPPVAKKLKVDLDCQQCGLIKSKYTCPKCAFRTCSLACVKEHKTSASCDGQRQPFEAVKKYSQFDDNVSIKDQTFLQNVKKSVSNGIRRTAPIKPPIATTHTVVDNKAPVALTSKTETVADKPPELVIDEGSDASVTDEAVCVEDIDKVSLKRKLSVDQNAVLAQEEGSDIVIDEETGEENDFLKKHGHGPPDPNALTSVERYLIGNVARRRIFININSPAESDGSRHEQFSDTIYWTIGLNFFQEVRKTLPTETSVEANDPKKPLFDLDDTGDEYEIDIPTNTSVKKGFRVESYNCKARNIPESLTVKTLIRQFVVPKQRGVVVSKSELDETAMTPFWEAGLDNVLVYMRVPGGQHERYYVVDKTKTILNNLRNRYVNGHPTFLIVLPKQFTNWKPLSEMEALELHEEHRIKNRERHQGDNRQSGRRGGHRGGRGCSGGGRGGSGFRGGRGGNRGRGGGYRGGRGGANGSTYRNNMVPYDLSNIFEPFPENVRLNRRPDFIAKVDEGQSSWASAVKTFRQPKNQNLTN